MISRPAVRRASSRKLSLRPTLRPKTSKKAAPDSYAATPPIRAPSPAAHVTKPMRPLTAYHVFFQIEREYIIQTTAGPNADDSLHADKSYLGDVPRRYRRIALRPDWYAGPGKRKKRKHRKSHGKIGFLELSRVISQRWATLGQTDPETKRFVARIAARELEEYRAEVRRYKALAEGAAAPRPPPRSPSAAPAPADAVAADADAVATVISPGDSPALRPAEVSSSGVPPMMPDLQEPMKYTQPERISPGDSPVLCPVEASSSSAPPLMPDLPQSMQYSQAESVELVLSLDQEFASSAGSVDDEIDYSICSLSNNGHYIPSPPESSNRIGDATHPDGTICDPLFELDDGDSFQQPVEKRCVSPPISETSLDDVDTLGDHGVFQRTAALLQRLNW